MTASIIPSINVSVVIPVFEAANFIINTLKTVVDQTILPLEIVIVDDGSQDNTCSIIESFCLANPTVRIRLLREPHRGPGSARNTGIRAAVGSWIAFLDSDDLWYPNKLEQIAVAHRTKPDTNFLCHNELHSRLENAEHVNDYGLGFRADISLSMQLFSKNRFSTSAVVCRRDLILNCGGFDEVLPNAQDFELWLRMSPSIKVLFVSVVLGVYVDRAGNISSGRIWRRYTNVLRVLHKHRKLVTTVVYLKTILRVSASFVYRGFRGMT